MTADERGSEANPALLLTAQLHVLESGQWAEAGARFSQIRLDTSWIVEIP
jgi:hypothetical protein